MNAQSAQSKEKPVTGENAGSKPPAELFKQRESQELVIGFSGPIGCGINIVIDQAVEFLEEVGYETQIIKLSEFITKLGRANGLDVDFSDPKTRYEKFQSAGNDLRKRFQNDILSELATSKIAVERMKGVPENITVRDVVPEKKVYLIDQLKHPEEVALFRSVYGNLFYMIGVLASYQQRKRRLEQESLKSTDAESVMDRDRREDIKYGQQLDKTLLHADLFIRNSHSNRNAIRGQLERFINLVHGKNGITPTQHEYAMYVAYSAGLRSACLSRQVGAAITDKSGNILATGCNDVPKAGGGLYTEADGDLDHRCVNIDHGKCFNDHYKNQLESEIKNILTKSGIEPEKADELSDKIRNKTRLKDLIEFSRSVHAEMDALTGIARTGGSSVDKGYLYSTTFPCHNCARHIVASGIDKVLYIEPYEKSLAVDLHNDAIEVDPEETGEHAEKVHFLHFEGIAPRRYQHFFTPRFDRKDDAGKATFTPVRESLKVIPQYLDSYKDLESKVLQHLEEQGISPQQLIDAQ